MEEHPVWKMAQARCHHRPFPHFSRISERQPTTMNAIRNRAAGITQRRKGAETEYSNWERTLGALASRAGPGTPLIFNILPEQPLACGIIMSVMSEQPKRRWPPFAAI